MHIYILMYTIAYWPIAYWPNGGSGLTAIERQPDLEPSAWSPGTGLQ